MKRRDFLKTAALPFILPPFRGRIREKVKDYGWLPPSLPSIKFASFRDTFPHLKNTGEGKVVLLYKYIESILKQSLSAHYQKGPDCTSHAGGLGIDFLQAIQALLRKDRWIEKVATEVSHIGGRQKIGKRNSGGVQISEFITFSMKYGTIFRKKYFNPNNPEEIYDFRSYNYNNCLKLEKTGIPEWLLNKCKKCQVIKAIKISTWNEARDAIRNLYPIVVGSKIGFDNAKRDKDGFAKPSGTWYHAWLLIAMDDRSKRPGGCLMSSHGDNWVEGPRRYNQPKGSIWVDRDTIRQMLNEFGDCYALCRLNGLEPKRYKLWPDT